MADADSTFKTFAEWCHTNHITLIINGGGPVGTRLNGFINKTNIHSTVFKSDGPLVSLAMARATPSRRAEAPSRRAEAPSDVPELPLEALQVIGGHLDPESQTRLGMAVGAAGHLIVAEGRDRAARPSHEDKRLHRIQPLSLQGARGPERLVWLHEYNVDLDRQDVAKGWGQVVAKMVTREALLTNELTALLDECSYHTRYIKRMNSPARGGGATQDPAGGAGNILVICDEGDDFSHLILGSLMINEDLARRGWTTGWPEGVMNDIREITFLRPGSLSQYENINRYILDSYYKYVNRVRDEPHHRLERIVHPYGQYVGAGHVLIADVTASSRENLYGAPDGARPPAIQSPNNGKSIYRPVYATGDRWPYWIPIPPRRIPTVLPPL